eukprot:m.289662 g.289662  ORF g.289662 m.289662 type:complete len:52 (-) comp16376_c3_seq5:190-345(-)
MRYFFRDVSFKTPYFNDKLVKAFHNYRLDQNNTRTKVYCDRPKELLKVSSN